MAVTRLFQPTSAGEAAAVLAEHGTDVTVIGGGTIVMAAVNDGRIWPRQAMSLGRAGLSGIERQNGTVLIGATTPVARLLNLSELPVLAGAAAELGGPAVRTTATCGGNLFASSPYGDLGVALLALDAGVELLGPGGERTLPLTQFYAERDAIAGTELVTRLRVPVPGGMSLYRKLGRRRANTPSVVSTAVRLRTGADGTCTGARIALGAVAPTPIRAERAESMLVGQAVSPDVMERAAAAAMEDCDPATDALATGWYRRRMVGVLVRRTLAEAIGRTGEGGSRGD